jgi:hypothetical protein
MDARLRAELLAMAAEDSRVREELVREGTIWEEYHPRMAEVHERNAARLIEIIAEHGWPGRSLAGEDGAEAAWRVLQHAIGNPPLQRRGVALLEEAAARGEVPRWQVAYLTDRVRYFEGKPEIYGTQYELDADGETMPSPIEDPDRVDERRRSVGLGTLEENTRRMRAASTRRPKDLEAFRKRFEDWAHSVGWRE